MSKTLFNIKARHAVHEEGTKYYQVITITESTSEKGVVVTHWGAYRRGASKYPKLHGETKVETCASGTHRIAGSREKGKSGRGYGNNKSIPGWKTEQWVGIEQGEFCETLEDLFKDSDREQIMNFFGIESAVPDTSISQQDEEDKRAEAQAEAEAEAAILRRFEDENETITVSADAQWGSW